MGEQARSTRTDLAQQLARDATGQDVGFDFFVQRKLLHRRRPDPVSADHPFDQTFMGKAVHALGFFVADAQGMDHRQPAWLLRCQKARLHGFKQAGRLHQTATATHQTNGVAVPDQLCSLGGCYEFAVAHVGCSVRDAAVQRLMSNSAAPFFITLLAMTLR